MSDWKIKLKRGNAVDAPPDNLEPGEPAIELDTGVLWYGNGDGESKRVRLRSQDIIGLGEAEGAAELDDRGKLMPSQLPVRLSTDAPNPGENDQGTSEGDLWLRYDPSA